MLGKRKQNSHGSSGANATEKKKWKEEIDQDSSAQEDGILEAKLLEGDLSSEDIEKLMKAAAKGQSLQEEGDDEDDLEYRKRRKYEEERQQRLIEAELNDEIKLKEQLAVKPASVPLIEEKASEGLKRDPEADERTLFVSNIHPEATEEDLEQIFKDFGQIKQIELMRVEGLTFNKGRAFVEFFTKEEASAASEAVNGRIDFKGKLLSVQQGLTGATKAKVEDKLIRQQQLEEEEQQNKSSSSNDEESEGGEEESYELIDTSGAH